MNYNLYILDYWFSNKLQRNLYEAIVIIDKKSKLTIANSIVVYNERFVAVTITR